MSHVDSVTEWIARLKAGDPKSSQPLWERYVDQLVRRARKKLGSAPDDLDTSPSTVQRKLRLIRRTWSKLKEGRP